MGAGRRQGGAVLMARRPDGLAPEKPYEGEKQGEKMAFLLHLIGMGMGLCTLVAYACIKVGAESEAVDDAS